MKPIIFVIAVPVFLFLLLTGRLGYRRRKYRRIRRNRRDRDFYSEYNRQLNDDWEYQKGWVPSL